MSGVINRFPTLAAMADSADLRCLDAHSSASDGTDSPEDTLRFVRHGDVRMVAEAEKLIDRLSLDLDVQARAVIADVAGAWPSVPDFLAGHPDCMRRRAMVDSDISPLAIWVVPSVSWQITPEQMTKRGTAILALVLALSRIRPISLGIVAFADFHGGQGDGVLVAPIHTAPLDIASAAYALTAPGFYRRLCYGLHDKLHGTVGKWPSAYKNDRPAYLANLLQRLGGDPAKDLIIDGLRASDPMVDNPLEWVQAQIARYGSVA